MLKITFMGTGNAFGHDGRISSCYLIQGSKTILLDAGYALFAALKRQNTSIKDLDAILLSHLHPDHYMGIPQIALENYYVIKREDPIPVYCPVGTERLIQSVSEVIYDREVVDHISDIFEFIEFQENETREIPGGKVSTFAAAHSGNARMQLIEIDDKKIGYTGDSAYIKSSIDALLDSDIMITEASSAGFSIPNHMTLEQILKFEVKPGSRVFLSHLGQSVIDNREKIKDPFYICEDNETIYLQ